MANVTLRGVKGSDLTPSEVDANFTELNNKKLEPDAAGNLGLGVTPSAWNSQWRALDFGGGGVANQGANTWFLGNAFFDGTNWRYKQSWFATGYQQDSGVHRWFTAPSGTAGNPITFTNLMTLDAAGSLLIGATSGNGARLEVTVADAVTAQRLVAATGRFRFRPYVDATNGATFESINTAESSYLPMTIFGSGVRLGNGNGIQVAIDSSNNVVFGTAALATTATAGFPWIPSCAGAPTGAPTAPYTNAAAMVVDTTNNRLYVRVGSTWRYASLI